MVGLPSVRQPQGPLLLRQVFLISDCGPQPRQSMPSSAPTSTARQQRGLICAHHRQTQVLCASRAHSVVTLEWPCVLAYSMWLHRHGGTV